MHRDSCGGSEDACCPHYRVVNSSAPGGVPAARGPNISGFTHQEKLGSRRGSRRVLTPSFYIREDEYRAKSEAVVTLVIPNERRKMSYFLLSVVFSFHTSWRPNVHLNWLVKATNAQNVSGICPQHKA